MLLIFFYHSNLRACFIAPKYLPAINTDTDAVTYMPKIYIVADFDKSDQNYEIYFKEAFDNDLFKGGLMEKVKGDFQ